MGKEDLDLNKIPGVDTGNTETKKEGKALGYVEGSGGALTAYYSDEEKRKILKEVRENKG